MKSFRRVLSLCCIFVILGSWGCSSKQKSLSRPNPTLYLEIDPALLNQYESALEASNEKACPAFVILSENSRFPLWLESRLHAAATCAFPVSIPSVEFPTHLRPLWSEAALHQALLNPVDINAIAKAHLTRSFFRRYPPEKIDDLKAAQVAATRSGNSALLKEIEYNLFQIAPRLNPHLELSSALDPLFIGNDFQNSRDFEKARFYFKKSFNKAANSSSHFAVQLQAQKAIRNSYKREQNKSEYVHQCQLFTDWALHQPSSDSKVLREAFLTWVRALWTQGDLAQAKKILHRAEKKIHSNEFRDEFEFIRGKMAEESGNEKSALLHFKKSVATHGPTTAFGLRSLFSEAWTLRKMGELKEARLAFEKYEEAAPDLSEKFKARFWRAMVLKDLGLWELATSEFERITRDDALGYYGVISYFELKQDLPPLQPVILGELRWAPLDPQIFSNSEETYVKTLFAVKDFEILRSFLKKKIELSQLKSKTISEGYLNLLKLNARAGSFPPLFGTLNQLDLETKRLFLENEPELLFPENYRNIVKSQSEKWNVEQELVYSIMRQESSFDPRARSPADAMGLMQVLPTDAESSIDRLSVPDININLGTGLLSKLQHKYNRQFILVAAGYNSSELAIEHWLKTRIWSDPLEFIEEIPFEETRTYVKLVLRNYVFYTRLRSPP